MAAAELTKSKIGDDMIDQFTARTFERKVMDFWLSACRDGLTPQEQELVRAHDRRNSTRIRIGRYAVTALGRARMEKLMAVAIRTGARMPPSWSVENPPVSAVAYCAQSVPHTIDRIILAYTNSDAHVVWHDVRAGINGLIGLSTSTPRLLVPGWRNAGKLQLDLSRVAEPQVVAALLPFESSKGESDVTWRPAAGSLIAAVDSVSEVIEGQQVLNVFSSVADTLPTVSGKRPAAHITDIASLPSWSDTRRSALLKLLRAGGDSTSPRALQFFEMTGSRKRDAAAVIAKLQAEGRTKLIADFKRHMRSRVIVSADKLTIREEAASYIAVTPKGPRLVANFVIDIVLAVTFAERAELCYAADLLVGDKAVRITLPSMSLVASKRLQEELNSVFSASDELVAAPTIVDHGIMNKHVLEYARREAAAVHVLPGVDALGWNRDRTKFYAPGVTLTAGSSKVNSCLFHPSAAALRLFGPVSGWSEVVPSSLPAGSTDFAAGLLAQVVRSFKRINTRPFLVRSDTETLDSVTHVLGYFGQRRVFELNPNVRATNLADGVAGYPFIAAGGAEHQAIPAGYVLIAGDGAVLPLTSAADRDALGRALQALVCAVVKWCLQTGASELPAHKSVAHNAALMVEGRWLLEHVCGIVVEDANTDGTELESLLAQIPYAELKSRLILRENLMLYLDIAGIHLRSKTALWDELCALDEDSELDENMLSMNATTLVGLLTRYYNRKPEFALDAALSNH